MSELFRPRRRPALRLVLASVIGCDPGVRRRHRDLAAIFMSCRRIAATPTTLALVRRSLTGRFKLPASVTIDDIRTHAGGYVAFRFACEADLHGIDRNDLPPGSPVPGSVYYVSRLTEGGRRHEVTVSIQPLLILQKVQ